MDLRHWSNLEAKYQMATLLAHPKSSIANIFGGTLHTIPSAGWRNWKNGRSVDFWRTQIAGGASEWQSKKDIDKWVIGHGVVPDFIMYEAGLNPKFKSARFIPSPFFTLFIFDGGGEFLKCNILSGKFFIKSVFTESVTYST